MKKRTCLVAVALLLILATLSAGGCTVPPIYKVPLQVNAELIALQYQPTSYSYSSGYLLFIDGQVEPLKVSPNNIEFVYDRQTTNPRVEKRGEKIIVLFKDKAQFREYLK